MFPRSRPNSGSDAPRHNPKVAEGFGSCHTRLHLTPESSPQRCPGRTMSAWPNDLLGDGSARRSRCSRGFVETQPKTGITSKPDMPRRHHPALCGVRRFRPKRGRRPGDDGWWLLAEGTGDGASLHFLPSDGVSSPVHVMRLAASPDRAFLSTAAADALVALRDLPYPVWRIAVDGRIVAGMQPDRLPPGGVAERDPPPTRVGLSAFSVPPGVIQIVADITSDDRLPVTYDENGDIVSSRVMQAPFGLIAVASRAQVLAALRTFEASEIVLYSWKWRLRAPAGCGSPSERRIPDA